MDDRQILSEIKRIVDDSYSRALNLLKDNIQNLHNLAACLIEKESLSGDEVDKIITAATPSCGQQKAEQNTPAVEQA